MLLSWEQLLAILYLHFLYFQDIFQYQHSINSSVCKLCLFWVGFSSWCHLLPSEFLSPTETLASSVNMNKLVTHNVFNKRPRILNNRCLPKEKCHTRAHFQQISTVVLSQWHCWDDFNHFVLKHTLLIPMNVFTIFSHKRCKHFFQWLRIIHQVSQPFEKKSKESFKKLRGQQERQFHLKTWRKGDLFGVMSHWKSHPNLFSISQIFETIVAQLKMQIKIK